MFNTNNSGYSLSDIAAVTSGNDGFFGGNSGWWLIILIILFSGWGGYGNGFGGSRAGGDYILASDMSMISRQMSDGFNSQERKSDSIANGICSLGYDQLAQMNGLSTNILTSANAIQTQLADCCCKTQQNIKDTQYVIGSTGADISRGVERGFADTNYNLATQANGITTAISNGFCQTNFNAQTNTRDIVDSQNAGTQAILARIDALESSRKDEKIAELQAQINNLNLAASQQAQNNVIINALRTPTPIPAYITSSPYASANTCCPCSCAM